MEIGSYDLAVRAYRIRSKYGDKVCTSPTRCMPASASAAAARLPSAPEQPTSACLHKYCVRSAHGHGQWRAWA